MPDAMEAPALSRPPRSNWTEGAANPTKRRRPRRDANRAATEAHLRAIAQDTRPLERSVADLVRLRREFDPRPVREIDEEAAEFDFVEVGEPDDTEDDEEIDDFLRFNPGAYRVDEADAPALNARSEYGARKISPFRCRARDEFAASSGTCGGETTDFKPYCSEHIWLLPYVRRVLDELADVEHEIARAGKWGGWKRVDVDGISSREILSILSERGPQTLKRLRQAANLPEASFRGYLKALQRAGLVLVVTVGSRRGITRRIVDLVQEST